jgi:hypothetical protein
VEIDLTQQKLPLGTHQLYVVGQAQTKYSRPALSAAQPAGQSAAQKPNVEDRSLTIYSTPFMLKITPTPVTTAAVK